MTDRDRFERLQALAPDAAPAVADWYAATLDPGWSTLCSFVPRGFAAYARILHAREFYDEHCVGSLTLRELEALVEVLGPFTEAPVLAGVWIGFGQFPRAWTELPVAEQRGREYHYFRRSLGEIVTLAHDLACVGRVQQGQGMALLRAGRGGPFSRLRRRALRSSAERSSPEFPELPPMGFGHPDHVQSPSQWWPEDRSWAVATEIDLDFSWVGGSEQLVAAVLSHPELEALPADPDASEWS